MKYFAKYLGFITAYFTPRPDHPLELKRVMLYITFDSAENTATAMFCLNEDYDTHLELVDDVTDSLS
jgi:hypothetical protein